MYKCAGDLNLSQIQTQDFVQNEVQAWIRMKLKECKSPQEQTYLRKYLK